MREVQGIIYDVKDLPILSAGINWERATRRK